jgi:hypothetical protein
LLSVSHPIGRFKARFFTGLGFSAAHWRELEAAFRRDHLTQDATPGEPLVHGQPYTIRAILEGPTGESAVVVSVWFVRNGEIVPRFVTAYPGGPS